MGQQNADGLKFGCSHHVCYAGLMPDADVACRWAKTCRYFRLSPKERAELWDKEHKPPAYARKSLQYR
jgi:hypothetical protein